MPNVIRKSGHHGFSLIEISIVLAIMGLIVGGVLGGASLKRSLQIKAVMDQQSRLNQGMSKFKEIYGGWPGDLWNATDKFGATDPAGNPVENGDGNDRINDDATHRETAHILHHLALAGLIEGGYDGGYFGGWMVPVNTKNLIYGPIDKKSIFSIENLGNGLAIFFSGITDADDNGIVDYNGGLGYNRGVFTPQEMQTIDTKYDDGLPNTGNIRGYNGSNAVTGCVSAGAYMLTVSTKDCYFGVIIQTMF